MANRQWHGHGRQDQAPWSAFVAFKAKARAGRLAVAGFGYPAGNLTQDCLPMLNLGFAAPRREFGRLWRAYGASQGQGESLFSTFSSLFLMLPCSARPLATNW